MAEQALDHDARSAYRDVILREAEAICRGRTLEDPTDADAWHLRGLLAARAGHDDAAIDALQRTIRLRPGRAACYEELGMALGRKGRHREATSAQLCGVRCAPAIPGPYIALARSLTAQHRHAEALLASREAVRLAPDDRSAVAALGDALLATGRPSEAIECYEHALHLAPRDPSAFLALGRAWLGASDCERAIATFRRGIEAADQDSREIVSPRRGTVADPTGRVPGAGAPTADELTKASLHTGLGEALFRAGRMEDAIGALRVALTLNPRDLDACRRLVIALELRRRPHDAAGAWLTLGIALDGHGRSAEAMHAYQQAISRKPTCLRALVNLGRVHSALGDPNEAIQCFEAALAIDPELPLAHADMGRALHAIGETDRGWDEFAWFCHPHKLKSRAFEQPVWDGSHLDGRTILLWADQELGDTIQFLRYIRVVKAHGAGRIVVECQARLAQLAGVLRDVDDVVARGTPLPDFDVHAPLTLIPIVLRHARSPVPCEVPYLFVPDDLVTSWRSRLAAGSASNVMLNVGLSWAGHPDGIAARARFMPLSDFAPFGAIPGVRFISLQMGPQALELASAPPDLRIGSLQNESCSITDTAALIMALDLVVTVDTMIPHLAGACGRPVWLLLPYAADWRWLQGRNDTPLYPTATLFRQARAGDWPEVLSRIETRLRHWSDSRASTPGTLIRVSETTSRETASAPHASAVTVQR